MRKSRSIYGYVRGFESTPPQEPVGLMEIVASRFPAAQQIAHKSTGS